MRMCSLETSVMLPAVVGAFLALVLANNRNFRMGEGRKYPASGASCCVKNEITPNKVQRKAGLLWRAHEVFSLLSSFLWEETCLYFVLRVLVVEGCMVFMEKVTHRSLNPVFISK